MAEKKDIQSGILQSITEIFEGFREASRKLPEGVEKCILHKNRIFPLQAQGKGFWGA